MVVLCLFVCCCIIAVICLCVCFVYFVCLLSYLSVCGLLSLFLFCVKGAELKELNRKLRKRRWYHQQKVSSSAYALVLFCCSVVLFCVGVLCLCVLLVFAFLLLFVVFVFC